MNDARSESSENAEISDAEVVEEAIEETGQDAFDNHIDDPVEEDPLETYEEHEERHQSLSSRILSWLVLLIAGGGIALWGGPKLAPQLPEWAAPAAKFLTPGGDAAVRDVAALRTEVTERLDSAPQGPTAEELTAMIQTEMDALQSSTDEKIAALEAQLASADSSNMDARISTIETQVEGVSAELNALTSSVQTTLSQGGTVSEEALADITSKSAEVEGLRAQLGEMTGQIGTLTQRIEDAETAAEARVAEAEAQAQEAEAKAAQIASNTAYQEALDTLTVQAKQGTPYTAQLAAFTETTDTEIPEILAQNANTGVAALSLLKTQFTELSHQSIRASIKADGEADGGSASKFGAFLKSRVASRSLAPVEGDGTDAVLSRMGAALGDDDLASVASEAAGLSENAAAPLTDWLAAVEARKSVLDILATLASQPS